MLAPGGRVAIQAITMPHDRMLATRNTYTWINKYIFPGGFLPSVEAIEEITRRHTHAAGRRPALDGRALRRDAAAVAGAVPAAPRGRSALGFDETFRGCGTSTWSTPRPASAPATSTSSSATFDAGPGRW